MAGSDEGLEIQENIDFQRREWRVQRVVWFLLALLLLAALAGLLGPGPLSSTSRSATGFDVHYLRFARWQAPQTMVITVQPVTAKSVALSINRSFLDSMQVQEITPQPADVKLAGDHVVFSFSSAGAHVPTDIDLDLVASSMGTVHATINLLAGPQSSTVDLTQLVYP